MSERKKDSLRWKKRASIIFGAALMLITDLYMQGFSLSTEEYIASSDKLDSSVTVAFISDLHNCVYGGFDQAQIMRELEKSGADLVLFGGDIIDQYGGTKNALTLMKAVSEQYPCCYAEGNHEQIRNDLSEFENNVTDLGISILKGDSEEFDINGQKIVVYGIIDSLWAVPDSSKYIPQLDACIDAVDPEKYNILLAHQPEEIEEYLKGDFDLILSGHDHGGQWRLPVILEQGLYAPDQGLLPGYTNGMYEYGDCVHIISRGLAIPIRMCVIPRIFNRPELSIVKIK